MIEEWYRIKKNNESKIVLLERDSFIYTFLDDSYILNYIFKYKITKPYDKICFPNFELFKVVKHLEELGIGYIDNKNITFKGKTDVYEKYLYNSFEYHNNKFLLSQINKRIMDLENTIKNIK